MYQIPFTNGNIHGTPTPGVLIICFIILCMGTLAIWFKYNLYPFKPVKKATLPDKEELLAKALNQLDQIKDLEYLRTTWRNRHMFEYTSLLTLLDHGKGVLDLHARTDELQRYLEDIQEKKLRSLIPEAIEKAKENWFYIDTQYLSFAMSNHKLTYSELRAMMDILVNDKILAGPYHRYPGRLMGSPEPPQGEQPHGH
jgi:hypothetical protein